MRFEKYLTPAEKQAYATIHLLPIDAAVKLDALLDRAARERGWMQEQVEVRTSA